MENSTVKVEYYKTIKMERRFNLGKQRYEHIVFNDEVVIPVEHLHFRHLYILKCSLQMEMDFLTAVKESVILSKEYIEIKEDIDSVIIVTKDKIKQTNEKLKLKTKEINQ